MKLGVLYSPIQKRHGEINGLYLTCNTPKVFFKTKKKERNGKKIKMCRKNGKKKESVATSVRYDACTAVLGHRREAGKGLEASCNLKCSTIHIRGENPRDI